MKTFSLLLLHPVLTPGIHEAQARTRLPARHDASGLVVRETELSRPYLPVIGAVPLRFGAEPPPPDLATRPPVGAPPDPAPAQTVAAVNRESVITPPDAPAATHPAAAEPALTPAPAQLAQSTPGILRDDTRPAPRPEDFLPFFQFPGGNHGSTISSPGPVPPSSATYQQK